MLYVARTLLEDASETGGAVDWPGGRGAFMVAAGDWAGATVTFQYQLPSGAWIDVDSDTASFTKDGMCGFEMPVGHIRAQITGTPTGVYAYVRGT